MRAYVQLLARRPAFLRLWASELVSMIGDWFTIVAVSVVSLRSPGGGVIALATSLAVHLLPQSLASPLGGYIADRFDKRRVLMIGSSLEALLTLAMAGAAAAQNVILLQVLLAIRSITSAAREPASASALPRVVERSELPDANALVAFTWSVAFAIGMSLGGLATAVGPQFALVVDAMTFVVAVVILRAVPPLPPSPRASTSVSGFRESLDVARRAARAPLRRSVFALAPTALAAGAAWLYLNLAGHALPMAAGAAATVGMLQAIRGAGTAIGPLSARIIDRAALPVDIGNAATLACVVGTLGLAWSPSLLVAVASAVVWGAGGGALWMVMTTEIQTSAEDGVRGRLIALSGLGFTVTMSAGALIAAVAADAGWSSLGVAVPVCVVSMLGFLWVRRRGEPAPIAAAAVAAPTDA